MAMEIKHPINAYGMNTKEGTRHSNEDQHLVVCPLTVDRQGRDIFFAAVYDGHGGFLCSSYCQRFLHKNLAVALGKLINYSDESVISDELFIYAIFAAFEKTEKDFLLFSALMNDYSGSCVNMLLIYETRIFVANLGDSKALLAKTSPKGGVQPFELSRDHKANLEKKRIEKLGGYVRFKRVNGTLAVSRAIGDRTYKKLARDDFVSYKFLYEEDTEIIKTLIGLVRGSRRSSRSGRSRFALSVSIPDTQQEKANALREFENIVNDCDVGSVKKKRRDDRHSSIAVEYGRKPVYDTERSRLPNTVYSRDMMDCPASKSKKENELITFDQALNELGATVDSMRKKNFKKKTEELFKMTISYPTKSVGSLKSPLPTSERDLQSLVSSSPEITVMRRSLQDKFLVLATDGFFDMFEPEKVVSSIHKYLKANEEINLNSVCQSLCEDAADMGSKDDITVVLVKF
ncbi:uncharacterized protein LOC126316784 [Schistocerca gregaria]|uniref:uncharacterized protein LOC126316784 n=1 Tax=Schistocerca gregaria TaxID=7010 RepID=UPI00211F0EF7|nr:uncharacterized protein LOC126316784 [Schistocerca gregaria]